MKFRRHALYYVPPPSSAWCRLATGWLGWDAVEGREVAHPEASGLPLPVEEITRTPRKYGLHATIKPPFALVEGQSEATLFAACEDLCSGLAPVTLDGLSVARLGRFLALRPVGDEAALNTLAASCVRGLDRFRAPASDAELARRRAGELSAAQDATLVQWGYPFVMEHFRFHITLSGRLYKADLPPVQSWLNDHLGQILPQPFVIGDLCLAGEAEDGRFHVRHRYPLSGGSDANTA